MSEQRHSEQETAALDANREHVFGALPEDIQSGIERLEKEMPNSAIVEFVNKQMGLNRGEKIIKLDGMLNKIGESIDSLVALKDPEEQEEALESCEIITNPYMNDEEKKQALKKLENLLG